jgi:FkbM family methyltransferase
MASAWGAHVPASAGRTIIWFARNTPFGRGSLRKAAFRSFSRVHSGPVDCTLWDLPVRLYPERNVSERKALLRPDQMDAREHSLLRSIMTAPGSVFVDVGGNAGLYSLDAAMHAGPDSQIVMIEPDPALIERFQFNLSQARSHNRVSRNLSVTCACVAISDQDGDGILSTNGSEGSRHLLSEASEGLNVKLKTLSRLAQEEGLAKIDIMKIDVEGHEDKVLPPFLSRAPETVWPSAIIIEHLAKARWKIDCIGDAVSKGFSIAWTTTNNTVLTR